MARPTATVGIAVQPSGFHLGLTGELRVQAVSANIDTLLSVPAAQCIGQTMTSLLAPDAVHDIRNRMALLRDERAVEHLFGCQLVPDGDLFDLSIYRVGDGFGVDAECRVDHGFGDSTGLIEGMLARLKPGSNAEAIATAAVGQLRSLTGYDCVTIHMRGQVLGHSVRNRQAPYMDQVPQPENAFMLVDRAAKPVAILTAGQDDAAIARSDLRAASPAELSWLDHSGAQSAFVLPLASEGEILGLASCTSARPRHISPERRGIARLFATLVALRLQVAELRSARDG